MCCDICDVCRADRGGRGVFNFELSRERSAAEPQKNFFVPMLKRMFTSQIRCSHGEHDVHQVNIAISF